MKIEIPSKMMKNIQLIDLDQIVDNEKHEFVFEILVKYYTKFNILDQIHLIDPKNLTIKETEVSIRYFNI